MTRADRIRDFLRSCLDGATLDQVMTVVHRHDPSATRNSVNVGLRYMADSGKVRIEGEHAARVFHPTDALFIDYRRQQRPERRNGPRHKAGKTAPKPKATAPAPTARKPNPAIRAALTNCVRPVPPPTTAYTGRHAESVEQFLARGGQIQQLALGEVSNPLRYVIPANELPIPMHNRQQPTAAAA